MTNTIAMVGSPTALGGHFGGMERGPADLRAAGLLDRLRARPALASSTIIDHGDAPNELGWAPDPDPVMKNRQLIVDYLGRLSTHIQQALMPALASNLTHPAAPDLAPARRMSSSSGDASGVIVRSAGDAPTGIADETHRGSASTNGVANAPPLLMLGGDCTTHSGTMAALKRHAPGARLAIAWFDAHGDFNVPETTPSGSIWGMPFAMLCGRGDPGLVAACDGPTVREEDAALLGAQVLDQDESRMLAASPVAQFGAGMLAGPAGLAALEGWARAVGERCDGLYIAFDLDAIDASEGVCVAMPESDGLSVDTSVAALRILARTNHVLGFGPTATMRRAEVSDAEFDRHVDIVARLAEAALGHAQGAMP